MIYDNYPELAETSRKLDLSDDDFRELLWLVVADDPALRRGFADYLETLDQHALAARLNQPGRL